MKREISLLTVTDIIRLLMLLHIAVLLFQWQLKEVSNR